MGENAYISDKDKGELELRHFKEMLRESNEEPRDSLNRSSDFVNSVSSSFSPRSQQSQKSPRVGVKVDSRPDEWLSPGSSKKKSYRVKAKSTPLGLSPPMASEKNPPSSLSSSSDKTGTGTTRHTLGSSPSQEKSAFLEETEQSKLVKKRTPGVTRHTLGGSSSHHKSSFSAEGQDAPDPEKYREILRASLHADDDLGRSQEFLNGGVGTPSSQQHSSGSHSFGKFNSRSPISSERPTEWLNTPTSERRKTYKVKSPAAESLSALPNLDVDDGKKASKVARPQSYGISPRKPTRMQSIPIAAATSKTPTAPTPSPVRRPRKTQSLPMGRHSPYKSPIRSNERVDRGRFVAAFSTFEKKNDLRPILHEAEENAKNDTLSPKPIVSPHTGARRNYQVSDAAKRRTRSMMDNQWQFDAPMESVPHDHEMHAVMTNLRKVAIAPNESMSEEERKKWIREMKRSSDILDIFEDMKQRGLISSNLGPNRIEIIRNNVALLQGIKCRSTPEVEVEVSETVRQYLRKLTPTSSGAVDLIQQAIARLRRIEVHQATVKADLDAIIVNLKDVLRSMQEGLEQQFFDVLKSMDADVNEESIDDVQEGIKERSQEDVHRQTAEMAKRRFPPQDANCLVKTLVRLQQLKMNKRQSVLISRFILNLRAQRTRDVEDTFDDSLAKLLRRFNSSRKTEITEILTMVHKLHLNDRERVALAEVLRFLGRKRGRRFEVKEAIDKLRDLKLTSIEAKESAGIIFNLRKDQKADFCISDSREMLTLRKIMAPNKSSILADVFSSLQALNLSKDEIDDITGTVVELGVTPLDPTDFQMITFEYVDGFPVMILNIPDGDDYAREMEELEIINYISSKKQLSGPRVFQFWIDLDHEDQLSDEEHAKDDSDFEKNSDTEEPPGEMKVASISNISVGSLAAKPLLKSSKQQVPKFRYYGEAQEVTDKIGKLDQTDVKKIKFQNKHHWRHKKHNQTVVNEKRWRFEEKFAADEVIWSPLSRDQYDRRKTVGASILKTMDKFSPLDDMLLDEFEEDDSHAK